MSSSNNVILVCRFSALGDVAMTVPVLQQVVALNPDHHVVMISDQKFEGLFSGINNLTFEGFDIKLRYRGVNGIFKIWWKLYIKYKIVAFIDLHGVLRTHLLRSLFFLSGKKVSVIRKGRKLKAALTRKREKKMYALPHTTQRYLGCFTSLGICTDQALLNQTFIQPKPPQSKVRKIGFAPFAKHILKMYPLEKMYEVVAHFDKKGYEIYFFGNGEYEHQLLGAWEIKTKHVVSAQKSVSLLDDMQLIATLDLMVTMDSANMHLASNANIPVISIWGPTHPFIGFYGFNQDPDRIIQSNLTCRPCSVYGNKPCWRKDHACMMVIQPQDIINKIEAVLN